MAPVRSVAIPTLIGVAAAFAQLDWTDQLATPGAIAPLIQATLCRSLLRSIVGEGHLSFVFSPIVHILLPATSPRGWNLMNTMAITKTRTSASTGDTAHGRAALSTPTTPAPATDP